MLDSLRVYYRLAANKILEVEKNLDGKTGEEKQDAVIDYLVGVTDIKQIPDFIENPVKRFLFGMMVDKIVEGYNWISGRNIKSIEPTDSALDIGAAMAEVTVNAISARKAIFEPKTVNERIDELLKDYNIAKEVDPVQKTNSAVTKPQEPTHAQLNDNWDESISFSLKWEGGKNYRGRAEEEYSMINKFDKGGPTNMGITLPVFVSARAHGIIPYVTLDNMTVENAKAIYKENYWNRYSWGKLSWPICLAALDMSINHGGFAYILQRACNKCDAKLVVDGKYGPKTFQALYDISWSVGVHEVLCEHLVLERKAYYDNIVKNDESQKNNLNGWYNRLRGMAEAMGVASPV